MIATLLEYPFSSLVYLFPRMSPHKWAVGTTFEWEFDFPITTNPAYEAKPTPKRKTRTSANPKAVSSRARKTSKTATVQTAKPKAS